MQKTDTHREITAGQKGRRALQWWVCSSLSLDISISVSLSFWQSHTRNEAVVSGNIFGWLEWPVTAFPLPQGILNYQRNVIMGVWLSVMPNKRPDLPVVFSVQSCRLINLCRMCSCRRMPWFVWLLLLLQGCFHTTHNRPLPACSPKRHGALSGQIALRSPELMRFLCA